MCTRCEQFFENISMFIVFSCLIMMLKMMFFFFLKSHQLSILELARLCHSQLIVKVNISFWKLNYENWWIILEQNLQRSYYLMFYSMIYSIGRLIWISFFFLKFNRNSTQFVLNIRIETIIFWKTHLFFKFSWSVFFHLFFFCMTHFCNS